MKQLVMKKMWELLRNEITSSKSAALKAAWIICKIKQGCTVSFNFIKADGTKREAVATPAPTTWESKGDAKIKPLHICTYFDQTSADWRSFDIRRLAV